MFVSQKRYRAILEALSGEKEAHATEATSLRAELQLNRAILEREREVQATGVMGLRAELEVAREALERLRGAHATRVRVGCFCLDPVALTARLRTVEPSLRAEYDGTKVVVYAERNLVESEFEAVCSILGARLDRT